MTFITPLMVIGALAASIPLAIHLFFRSRYRTVKWAAMKFLLTSVEQTSRRLKFQEYMLLLLRMILLTLLAVAFMRPVNLTWMSASWIVAVAVLFALTISWWLAIWPAPAFVRYVLRFVLSYFVILILWVAFIGAYFFVSAGPTAVVRGKGDAVDAVFVFDLSYSMAAKDEDGKNRLERAKDEALRIIGELPPHSTVQIITCAGKSDTFLGPHSPGNLDQSRRLIEDLSFTHLNTDLYQGVKRAEDAFKTGQASNKELYIFSDMQKSGFEQHSGELKKTLLDIKEKAIVHFVRCGTRTLKNIAVVDIKPQSGVPRPGDRVGFAVLVRNSGREAVQRVTVSLAVDGDEKNGDSTEIAKITPGETYAVTLTGKLDKPGLRVLTAKITNDDLEPDNRFDQVILVHDKVNILVVDGGYKENEPSKSSSYFLMHALLPVKETERALYHLQPRVVPARLASPALLAKQDLCILVNVSLQPKAGQRAETAPSDFVEALEPFVKKGHGLIIFGGENVHPAPYNRLLGKADLLPMPLKGTIKAADNKPFLVDRNSFGPPAFWKFRDVDYYKDFSKVEVWQSLQMDEGAPKKKAQEDEKKEPEPANGEKNGEPEKKDDNPVSVVVRLNNGQPLIASKKVGTGEVIFVGTSADMGALDEKTLNPSWTDWPLRLAVYQPFIDVLTSHLLHGQSQNHNIVAGQALVWNVTEKTEHIYSLVHPDKNIERLDPPSKFGNRMAVRKPDVSRAGVYRVLGTARDAVEPMDPVKTGLPIAVAPDLSESEDLTSLTEQQIDDQLGFAAIHLTAGGGAAGISTGSDRQNREWTVWALMAVLMLVLLEVAFAWWCGRGW